MIPAALFYAKIRDEKHRENCVEEVRALELGPDFFTFRLKKGCEWVTNAKEAEIGFGSVRKKGYDGIRPDAFRITLTESDRFYDVYRYETQDEAFRKASMELTAEYTGYIKLRLTCDDAELANRLTGYDVDETKFPENFEQFRREYNTRHPFRVQAEEDAAEAGAERGIMLSFPDMWERYLKTDKETFIREWFGTYAGVRLDAELAGFTHLYIGSQFCMLRWPDAQITELLDKAVREGLEPVVCLAPMQEALVARCRKRLENLASWCIKNERRLEIVSGDLGQMRLLTEIGASCFKVTLGVLAVRHRKDSRRKWIASSAADGPHTWLDDDSSRELLQRKLNVIGAAYEQCGDGNTQLPDHGWKTTVFTPYYQMNTSAMCTLYASVVNGSRGRQVQNIQCPVLCREKCFLYPRGLNTVGIGNTLFGVDPDAWNEEKKIKGADRYVFNFM